MKLSSIMAGIPAIAILSFILSFGILPQQPEITGGAKQNGSVPNVVGMEREEARKVLESAGYRLISM